MVFPAIALVGSAAANVATSAYHAVQMNKMQQGFQKKLDNDAARIEYIKLIVDRYKSVGSRIAKTTGHKAGTQAFDLLLKKALINDMNYRAYCEADIYMPMGPNDTPGRPRNVWATISRSGYVKPPTVLPPDVGPIWSTGCKNANDEFRIVQAEAYKGERRFDFLKTVKLDIGATDLLLRFGTGLFLVVVAIVMIKIQRAVIKEQQPFVVAKKKSKAKKKAKAEPPKP